MGWHSGRAPMRAGRRTEAVPIEWLTAAQRDLRAP